jgi:hypothetical protein
VTPRARLRLLHPAAVRPGATLALGVLPAGGFFALAPLYAGRAGLSPAAVMALFGGVIFAARTIGAGSAAAGAAAPAAALLLQARRERPAP